MFTTRARFWSPFSLNFIWVKEVNGERIYPTLRQDGKGTAEGKSKITRKSKKKTETWCWSMWVSLHKQGRKSFNMMEQSDKNVG